MDRCGRRPPGRPVRCVTSASVRLKANLPSPSDPLPGLPRVAGDLFVAGVVAPDLPTVDVGIGHLLAGTVGVLAGPERNEP